VVEIVDIDAIWTVFTIDLGAEFSDWHHVMAFVSLCPADSRAISAAAEPDRVGL
jgi:hypothetical protein